jgi:hypothetical protein
MPNLPVSPARIAKLRLDKRGYPVPWFVQWMAAGEPCLPGVAGAEPDFRVIDDDKRRRAYATGLCWICGEPMGIHRIFAIGPMCLINLTTMEPPAHRTCAEYAVRSCPFLTQPKRRRNGEDMPEAVKADGEMIERNPGVTALVEARSYRRFSDGKGGWLIRLIEPTRVDWWAYGRQATVEEVRASIESGYPLLLEPAQDEGADAVNELARLTSAAAKWLPAA